MTESRLLSLNGKNIVITGASSGIGYASAILFSQLGARIYSIARNEARLTELHLKLKGNGHAYFIYDLNDSDGIPSLLKNIANKHGPLSGLFHAAGVGMVKMISIVKPKDIDMVFSSSIKAALMLARGFIQNSVFISNAASLVFMSSAASICGVPGMTVYSASKAAIDGLVRSLACELAPKKVRVNSIVAGAVKTDMHEKLIERMNPDEIMAYEKKHPLGFGNPEDIAYAAAFLLSDASSWITGTSLVVDGGYSCQ